MEAMDEEDYFHDRINDQHATAMDIEVEEEAGATCSTLKTQSLTMPTTSIAANRVGDEEFPVPLLDNGRYRNPWGPFSKPTVMNSLNLKHFFCSKHDNKMPKKSELDKTLPVIKPDLSEFDISPSSGIRHLWIGQSTSLVQMDGITILTDPMFSERCSPLPIGGYKRLRPTPCSISELPHVDIVVISHTHCDHLDYASVMALNQRFGNCLRWYVPQGLMKWMRDCGIANVVEMTWWQEDVYSDDNDIQVVCTPCQHWGKRTARDENKVLWCSWCVIGPRHSFFFAGDTAYCDAFRLIGKHYGPFTLSTIPIGAYTPRATMSNCHVDPENAVNIHDDVQSQTSIAIHWGTFSIANEPYLEPKQLLEQEVENRGMRPSSFVTVNHGEIILVGADGYADLD